MAKAETLQLGDHSIDFEPGERYCALDPAVSEYDRVLLEGQQKANAGLNEIIAIFADCGQLDQIRSGQSIYMEPYGVLLTAASNGRPTKLSGYTRARFIAEAAQALSKGVSVDEKDISRRFGDALDEVVKEGLIEADISGIRELGILHQDQTAAYYGILSNVRLGNIRTVQAGVGAITLVKQHIVQYTVYSRYVNKSTFDGLLAESRAVMQLLATRSGFGAD